MSASHPLTKLSGHTYHCNWVRSVAPIRWKPNERLVNELATRVDGLTRFPLSLSTISRTATQNAHVIILNFPKFKTTWGGGDVRLVLSTTAASRYCGNATRLAVCPPCDVYHSTMATRHSHGGHGSRILCITNDGKPRLHSHEFQDLP